MTNGFWMKSTVLGRVCMPNKQLSRERILTKTCVMQAGFVVSELRAEKQKPEGEFVEGALLAELLEPDQIKMSCRTVT